VKRLQGCRDIVLHPCGLLAEIIKAVGSCISFFHSHGKNDHLDGRPLLAESRSPAISSGRQLIEKPSHLIWASAMEKTDPQT
jgi:hypothetical protein